MQIIQAPHPVLATPAKHIKTINKTILDLIESMKQTLDDAQDPEGVGLAAPQVGEGLQLFIIKESRKSPVTIYINPKVTLLSKTPPQTKKEKEKKEGMKLEGCLSLKDIWGTVKRSPKISIKYLDEKGKEHKKICTGFIATIMQHEYDHLNGILFPRRVLEQKGQLYKSYKNDKDEDEFEEISI